MPDLTCINILIITHSVFSNFSLFSFFFLSYILFCLLIFEITKKKYKVSIRLDGKVFELVSIPMPDE